ncbi:MAG: hypothetical protein J6A19_15590 [Oscillospiraceae bacterium]|nr:hypothetical protein [Oscillospiraceae bacterium]
MPKIKPSPIKAQAEIVHNNIVYRGALFGCKTDRDFGGALGIDPTSFMHRRHDPRLWRLDELIRATIAFKCTLGWLMTDHTGQITEDKP